MTTPAIRPLPYRLRPASHQERQSNFARVAGPALTVFGLLCLPWILGW